MVTRGRRGALVYNIPGQRRSPGGAEGRYYKHTRSEEVTRGSTGALVYNIPGQRRSPGGAQGR